MDSFAWEYLQSNNQTSVAELIELLQDLKDYIVANHNPNPFLLLRYPITPSSPVKVR